MKDYLKIEEDAHKLQNFDTLARAGISIGIMTLGEPAAAILGNSMAAIVKSVLREKTTLFHNKHQKIRKNMLIASMVEKASQYESTHHSSTTTNKDAKEIFSDLYTKCETESEEKKIKYMGYLAVNQRENPEDYPLYLAHQFINDLEEFTYKQLCVLSLIYRYKSTQDPIGILNDKQCINTNNNDELKYITLSLQQKGYINDHQYLTLMGKKFVELTHLYEIPFEDAKYGNINFEDGGYSVCPISNKQYERWTKTIGASPRIKLEPNDKWVAEFLVFSDTGYQYTLTGGTYQSINETISNIRPTLVKSGPSNNETLEIRNLGDNSITIPLDFKYLVNEKEFNKTNRWYTESQNIYANVWYSQSLGLYVLVYPEGKSGIKKLKYGKSLPTRLTNRYLRDIVYYDYKDVFEYEIFE